MVTQEDHDFKYDDALCCHICSRCKAMTIDPNGFAEDCTTINGRTIATLTVTVELDDVPGWGNIASDYEKVIQRTLDDTMGHYHPTVTLVSCSDPSRLNARSLIHHASEKLAEERRNTPHEHFYLSTFREGVYECQDCDKTSDHYGKDDDLPTITTKVYCAQCGWSEVDHNPVTCNFIWDDKLNDFRPPFKISLDVATAIMNGEDFDGSQYRNHAVGCDESYNHPGSCFVSPR